MNIQQAFEYITNNKSNLRGITKGLMAVMFEPNHEDGEFHFYSLTICDNPSVSEHANWYIFRHETGNLRFSASKNNYWGAASLEKLLEVIPVASIAVKYSIQDLTDLLQNRQTDIILKSFFPDLPCPYYEYEYKDFKNSAIHHINAYNAGKL